MNTWIPCTWAFINLLTLIISSFSIQGGLWSSLIMIWKLFPWDRDPKRRTLWLICSQSYFNWIRTHVIILRWALSEDYFESASNVREIFRQGHPMFIAAFKIVKAEWQNGEGKRDSAIIKKGKWGLEAELYWSHSTSKATASAMKNNQRQPTSTLFVGSWFTWMNAFSTFLTTWTTHSASTLGPWYKSTPSLQLRLWLLVYHLQTPKS